MALCDLIFDISKEILLCNIGLEDISYIPFIWDYSSVALSIAICILYSGIACDIYSKSDTSSKSFLPALKVGSIYGMGIFSMHFIGMYALTSPGPMQYDIYITLLSLILAICGTSLTLYLLSKQYPIFITSVSFGLTICIMHYTGMLSLMANPFQMHHRVELLLVALLYAISGSWWSLKFFLKYLENKTKRILCYASITMGFTISGMHYCAMLAMEFSENSSYTGLPHDGFLSKEGIISCTFLMLLITMIIYINNSINSERFIVSAKKNIEDLYKQTRESIKYSSLIQHSIIPNDQLFRKIFSDYFTLWLPRDVIGGDVYLLEKLRDGNESLLMVIDCTGHGVPGAFVTMLVKAIERQAIGKINEDINIDVSPAWILKYFNRTIKKLLNQEDRDSKSNVGFDGGILLYDHKLNTIKFSGARMSLFFIQGGVLKSIKGDRSSVGYREDNAEFNFNEHDIKIDQDSYLYLTTDGYIDQNGGEKGFPLGRKRFEKILLDIHDEPFSVQKSILLEKLKEYRQHEAATDDITIIGVKLQQS